MKIVIAPDKFKGCLDAPAVAAAIARGVRRVMPDAEVDLCSIADGGEGTVAALVAATGGRFETRRVMGPLPEMRVDATFGVLGDGQTAVVEMAAASGLSLLKPDDRNPLATTTFGTGQLLVAAAKLGVRRIILGIGGSATVDAGLGCAQACGLPVLLDHGEPLSDSDPICGRDMDGVVLVKHGRGGTVERLPIVVACDVTNPLFGPNGAAAVFGPQKGASPADVEQLDRSLRALATRLGKLEAADTPGAGAAGGLGFGMLAFFNATLGSGVQLVLDAVNLRDRLAGADLCITGEGRLDASSLNGKAPVGVARLCREIGVPCVALVGSTGSGAADAATQGITASYSIADQATSLDDSMQRAGELLEELAGTVLSDYQKRYHDQA